MSEEATLLAPKPVRSPLLTSTNIPINGLTSSASLLSIEKGKRAQAVRRKSSFVRRLDSSESVPSSHDSIFIAEYLSPYNSEESGSGYKLDTWDKAETPQIPLSPRLDATILPSLSSDNDENGNQRLSIGITPILYGHGTALTTIIEQKSSIPTLRGSTRSTSTTSEIRPLARPRSASDLTGSTTSFHAGPLRTGPGSSPLRNLQFSTSGIIRRIHSLSADDSVDSIKLSWPAGYDPQRVLVGVRGKSSFDWESETASAPMSPINEIYAQPLRPMQPPVKRPDTPEGMPSWTAAQQRQPRMVNGVGEVRRGWGLHEASSMLQRLFSNRSQTGAVGTANAAGGPQAGEGGRNSGYGIRGPWDGVPTHRRTVSAPVLRGAPRFRPVRSAHGVARLEMHPFARAGGSQLNSKGDQVESADMNAAPDLPAPRRSGSLRGLRHAHRMPLGSHPIDPDRRSTIQDGGWGGPSQEITLVDVTQPLPREVSLRAKGKRKPGQRVRFTPSTADPGTLDTRESLSLVGGRPGDVKVCPHKNKEKTKKVDKAAGVQLWDISAAPLAGAYDATVPAVPPSPTSPTTANAEPHDLPLLNTNRQPISLSISASPTLQVSGLDGTRSPAESGFKARTHCWRCRLERAGERVDRAWEGARRGCGWYCCGIEMDGPVRGSISVGAEMRVVSPEVGAVRVRSLEGRGV